jgi:hypothetical protein
VSRLNAAKLSAGKKGRGSTKLALRSPKRGLWHAHETGDYGNLLNPSFMANDRTTDDTNRWALDWLQGECTTGVSSCLNRPFASDYD